MAKLDIALWIDRHAVAGELAFLRHLVTGIKSSGHDVTIITPDDLELHGLPLLASRHLTYVWGRFSVTRWLQQRHLRELVADLTQAPPDVLIAWGNIDVTPVQIAQATLNLPLLVWLWDAAEGALPLARLPSVVHCLAASSSILARAPHTGSRGPELLRPGVFADESVACYDAPGQPACLVSLDPLTDVRVFEPLFSALRTLADEGLDWLLFAYDTGRQESAVWQLAAQKKLLDRISFVPFQHEAESLLLHGDIFVQVNGATRIGYRTIEAFAKGLTVLTRPNVAADFFDDGRTCRVLRGPTATEWTTALREWIADRPRAIEVARAGQQLMRNEHGMSDMLDRLIGICNQAAGAPIPLRSGASV